MQIVYIVLFVLIPSALCQNNEGDLCKLPNANQNDGNGGVCVLIDKCERAKKLVSSNEKPLICGFKDLIPIVCCPQTAQVISPNSKSQKACLSFKSINGRNNQRRQARVAMGTKTLSQEFPHMALLGYGDKNNIEWLCGGSVISDQYILTAAHCVTSQKYAQPKWVRLGDLDIKSTTDDADPKDYDILETIPHPQYRPSINYHDIALLKVKGPIQFSSYIKPICLHTKIEIFSTAIVTGWGYTNFGGDFSSHLLKANLQYINHEECEKIYNSGLQRRLPNGLVEASQLCFGSSNGSDSCQGDAGGPLQYFSPEISNYVLTGITSFGKACGIGGSSGVYTRVSYYVPWIEGIVWPN